MTAARDLLHQAERHGLSVEARDGRLKLSASRKPPDSLVAQLQAHKAELLALLGDGIRCPYCGDPLDAGEEIDATDGHSSARIHRRCLDGWAEATAPAWQRRHAYHYEKRNDDAD